MKKTIIVVIVLLFSISLGAQVIINGVDINTKAGVEYCELVGYGKFLSAKKIIYVDYGQKRKLLTDLEKFYIMDKDGNKVKFYSMVQALNFMSENGWKFTHSYIAKTQSKGIVYHYLLKRKK